MAIMQTARRCDHQSHNQTTGLSDRQSIGHQTTRTFVHQATNSSDHQTTWPFTHPTFRPSDQHTVRPPYHQMISHCPIPCRMSQIPHTFPFLIVCRLMPKYLFQNLCNWPNFQVHFLWHEKLLGYQDLLRNSIYVTPSSFSFSKTLSSSRDVYIICLYICLHCPFFLHALSVVTCVYLTGQIAGPSSRAV